MRKSSIRGGEGGEEEPILLSLRKTKKAFLLEYFCAVLLLVLFFYLENNYPGRNLQFFALALAIFSVGSAEISRLRYRYEITASKIFILSGIIHKHKKIVYLYTLAMNIPDINIKQNFLQRLFDYGTISVEITLEGNAVELKDIDNPHQVMDLLEDLIKKHQITSLPSRT